MSGEIPEWLRKAAAARNTNIVWRFDLERQLSIISGYRKRNAGKQREMHYEMHAEDLQELLAQVLGEPLPPRMGEALLVVASHLAMLAVAGAYTTDLTNVVAYAGYELHTDQAHT